MEKVSLYIPCFNAEKYIKECLDSIRGQSYKIDEIIVIDDGSTDSSFDIFKNYPVKIIRNLENKGLAACRNIAFKEAKNQFVAALDADCVAGALWLAELMKCFVSEDIAGAGGILIERYTSNVADKWRSVHMVQQWGAEILEDPPFLYGNNTLFRKEPLTKVGFYNEKYKTNYEDVDISMRLYDSGFSLIYNPKAQVEHIRKDTIISILLTHWSWRYYSHKNQMCTNKGFRKLALKIGCIGGYTGDFLREDIQEKKYNLLVIDFIAIFYCYWLSLKDCFKELLSWEAR